MKEIKKAKMSQIVGGTTTTEMIEVGVRKGESIVISIPEPGDNLINSSSKRAY